VSFLTIWPYLLLIPALLLGILLGWNLHVTRQRRKNRENGNDSSPAPASNRSISELKRATQESEAEKLILEARLAALNQQNATARQQLQELDQEHTRLLVDIDEQRSSVLEQRSALQNASQHMATQQDVILNDIDSSGEELEMLEQLSKTYEARINRLSQQVSWQDSELQRLRQTVKNKTGEIDEARALIDQRDADLRRLILQRQQREADLARVRQQVRQHNEELRRLVEHQAQQERFPDVPPTIDPNPHVRRDITPPNRRQISSGDHHYDDE
jgi:chromosome segregation ATPase